MCLPAGPDARHRLGRFRLDARRPGRSCLDARQLPGEICFAARAPVAGKPFFFPY